MYRLVGELTIDPDKAAGCDSIIVDIDDSKEPISLRVSCFMDNHFQDEIIMNLNFEGQE